MASNLTKIEHDFWQHYHRFSGTALTTEAPHPDTLALSQLASSQIQQAIEQLHQADIAALQILPQALMRIPKCRRIFILGCGASGRMAVWLENIWRRLHPDQADKIVGVIAGGDYALIRSIEQFEDQTTFAAKQLNHYGFSQEDLLIATSASGESPFIMAAVEYALNASTIDPWLLYCNPTDTLVARNPQHILQHNRVKNIDLCVGPMALSGSTRMQATTAMQLWLGWALFPATRDDWQRTLTWYQQTDFSGLENPISQEANYLTTQANPNITYRSTPNIGLTVMADMTERTPTFNIPDWFQFQLEKQSNNQQAWQALLARQPVCLNWPNLPQTTRAALLNKTQMTTTNSHAIWQIESTNDTLTWHWNQKPCWQLSQLPHHPLYQEIWLKCCLNIHSTLVMGKLGFYEGNIMTHLQPTNHKLIDRTVRYLQQKFPDQPYQTIAKHVFTLLPDLKPGQSLIQRYQQMKER